MERRQFLKQVALAGAAATAALALPVNEHRAKLVVSSEPSAAAPAFSFSDDSDVGFYTSADRLGIVIDGKRFDLT